jgi:hypothetical protein
MSDTNEEQEVLRLMYMLNSKCDALNTQLIQLGIFVEWLADQIEPHIAIDPETFPPFAEARFAEIQKQAKEFMKQQLNNEATARSGTAQQLDLQDE